MAATYARLTALGVDDKQKHEPPEDCLKNKSIVVAASVLRVPWVDRVCRFQLD